MYTVAILIPAFVPRFMKIPQSFSGLWSRYYFHNQKNAKRYTSAKKKMELLLFIRKFSKGHILQTCKLSYDSCVLHIV